MKNLILISFILLGGHSYAGNPQERVCRVNNASFMGLEITTPETDNIGLCEFSKQSVVGSISLIENLYYKKDSMAIHSFKITKYRTILDCEQLGSQEIQALHSNGRVYTLCAFEDYSFIGLDTLRLGWFSNVNLRLMQLL